jgi:hypothetical protein
MTGLVTKLPDLTVRILSLQRGEIDHIQYQLQAGLFRFLLDTSFGESGSPFLHTGLVDPGR